MQGAAYAAFRRVAAGRQHEAICRAAERYRPTSFSTALHETGDLVAAALGDDRRRELRAEGAAMSMDEAISYALANIDPKLLTGPIASIDR